MKTQYSVDKEEDKEELHAHFKTEKRESKKKKAKCIVREPIKKKTSKNVYLKKKEKKGEHKTK